MSSVTEKELAGDERWALVNRVATSRHFGKAAQLRQLLLYLAEKAISSPTVDVTEQEIGSGVLGRRPGYDPQADNIVRVQVRRLRQKLEEYFAADGQREPVVMVIPKGSHVLRFERRTEPVAAAARSGGAGRLGWVAAVVAAGAIAFFLGRYSMNRSGAPAAELNLGSRNPLWVGLFMKDQPTTIVIADSSLVVVQDVLQRNFTLNEYIDRSYRGLIEAVPDPALRDALRMIAGRQHTSLADATVSGQLRSMGARMGAKVAVRYARHMNIRDFNAGNFVLVGSRLSVPWVELFEPSLNFRLERIGKEPRFGIRNRQPVNGEAAVYGSVSPLAGSKESFAAISLVPNLSQSGMILMLSGLTMEATEAAGEFSMSNDFPALLAKILGPSSAQSRPYFEILLKTAVIAGAPHKVDVVAWRKPNI
jgi:hypothetical protein